MEEQTGFNGFTPSDYANELYRDAKANSQRRDRLQQRIFKAGIEYYEARAKYCYYLAENATIREFKIWTDFLLDDWTGDSDI